MCAALVSTQKTLFIAALICTMVILWSREYSGNTEDVTRDKEPLRSASGIPLVLHQTWSTTNIAASLTSYVLSWRRYHPTWQYRFWTDKQIGEMVAKEYPELLSTFLWYPKNIYRADAMRYMVLYKYGGIYADLDVECLKPMDDILDRYPCILGQEIPIHHTHYVDGFLSNAVMMCRPGHPFLEFVLDNLPKRAKYHKSEVLKATGPFMLESLVRRFLNMSKIPQRYDGVWFEEAQLYIAPWQQFLPTFDNGRREEFYQVCNETLEKPAFTRRKYSSVSDLPGLVQFCQHVNLDQWRNKPTNQSYTDHHWVHSWSENYSKYHNFLRTVNITKLVDALAE